MTSKILRFILDLSRAMADRRKNRGRGNNKKLNILRTKKAFQMTQKAFFITLQGLSFCEKKKNSGEAKFGDNPKGNDK